MWQDNGGLIGRGAGRASSGRARKGRVKEGGGMQENLKGGRSPAKGWGGPGLILQPQIKALTRLYR